MDDDRKEDIYSIDRYGYIIYKLNKVIYKKNHIIMHPYPLIPNYQRYIALVGKQLETHLLAGLLKEDVDKGLFKEANCAVYALTVNEVQLQKMNHYIKEIEAQKGEYRYNLLGLLGFLFNKPIQRKKAFFCSQFVATVLKECNIIDFGKSPSLVAPNDLQKVSKCQLVYEGELKAYQNKGIDENVRVPFRFIPA